MPRYDYKCTGGHKYELQQPFGSPSEHPCEKCGKPARRLLNAPPLVFKGGGFYKTESRGRDTSDSGSDSGSDTGDSGSDAGSSAKRAKAKTGTGKKAAAKSSATSGAKQSGSAKAGGSKRSAAKSSAAKPKSGSGKSTGSSKK